MKVLYLVSQQKREGAHMTGWINGWKTRSLDTLTVHYGDRIANHVG